jgi:nicotinamide mononucleotide (NMN) deamidase PncC
MAQTPTYIAVLDADGGVIAREMLTRRDSTKPFSSGAVGYNASAKMLLRNVGGDDARHQISFSAVEIGTKKTA